MGNLGHHSLPTLGHTDCSAEICWQQGKVCPWSLILQFTVNTHYPWGVAPALSMESRSARAGDRGRWGRGNEGEWGAGKLEGEQCLREVAHQQLGLTLRGWSVHVSAESWFPRPPKVRVRASSQQPPQSWLRVQILWCSEDAGLLWLLSRENSIVFKPFCGAAAE